MSRSASLLGAAAAGLTALALVFVFVGAFVAGVHPDSATAAPAVNNNAAYLIILISFVVDIDLKIGRTTEALSGRIAICFVRLLRVSAPMIFATGGYVKRQVRQQNTSEDPHREAKGVPQRGVKWFVGNS
jgi:hypothetical protein